MMGQRSICKCACTKAVVTGFLFALLANATVQTAALSLSGASGAPGATVTLDVSLASVSGTPPDSIQWDLNYSTSDLSLVTGTYDGTGAAASGAGKSADCNIISAGDVRCIVFGTNSSAIGAGVLATLTFKIASGTTSTSTVVSVISAMASDGNANALNTTDSNATVTIDQPAVLSAVSCNPTTVLPPAQSTCTVSLGSDASSSTTVNLSSSASAAAVPPSVNIASGSSSTTFTVNSSTVSTITTAIITAKIGTTSSQTFSLTLTPASTCAYSLNSNSSSLSSSAGSGSFNVVTSSGCAWSVTNNSTFITITAGGSGTGNGTVSYSVTANSGASRIGTLTIATQTFTVTQAGLILTTGLAFYPLTPCRIADTRTGGGFSGAFGAPSLVAGATRNFPIQQSACNVPATAQAYSLNITVVPNGALGYLTAWPAGSPVPVGSTMNSPNGSIVANAAIVPAGEAGAISLYASNTTNAIIDINGYFAPPGAEGLAFYPVTPCRVADTRVGSGFSGAFGQPSLVGTETRSFPVQQSSCGIPSTAQVYSLRMTVVAPGPLVYITTWPAGLAEPVASTLNDLNGGVVGNQAIVPAGSATGGPISVYASNNTDLVVDINGYFAPPGPGALYFYPLTPCRIADTRSGSGFTGLFGSPSLLGAATRTFPMLSSSCAIPSSAQVYSLNITVVVPTGGHLNYLTAFPAGDAVPIASTVNAVTGGVVGSAAIVPSGASGAISAYASNPTDLIIDSNGYFGP